MPKTKETCTCLKRVIKKLHTQAHAAKSPGIYSSLMATIRMLEDEL